MTARTDFQYDPPKRSYRSITGPFLAGTESGVKYPVAVTKQLERTDTVERYLEEAKVLTVARREEFRTFQKSELRLNAQRAATTPPAEFEPLTPKFNIDQANAILAAYDAAARAESALLANTLSEYREEIYEALEKAWAENVAFEVKDGWQVKTLREKEAAISGHRATILAVHRAMSRWYGLDPDQRKLLDEARDELLNPFHMIDKRRMEAAQRDAADAKAGKVRSVGGLAGLTPAEVREYKAQVAESHKPRKRQLTGVPKSA